jgi:hypothetical protein
MIATHLVSFAGGPLDGMAGELLSMSPIGIDGGDDARGVYREAGRGAGGDVVLEWESKPPGEELIR